MNIPIHVGMLLATIHLGMLTPSASLSVGTARVVRQLHPTPTHRTAQPAMLTLDRRAVTTLAPAAATYTLLVGSPDAATAAAGKVVVLGGAGFLGAHVAQLLVKEGATVVSVARSPADAQAARVQKYLGAPLKIGYEVLDASKDDLSGVLKGSSAVVSCVGVLPGDKNQRAGNGAVNEKIAAAAKAAGAERLVYVSVASAIANGPGKFLFGDYVKGKAEAEAAVGANFGASNSLILKPGIISGRPDPGPPGPPSVKEVPVEVIARAAVAGALGRASGVADGADEIAALAK